MVACCFAWGCPFGNPLSPFWDSGDGITHEEKDVSGRLALGLGGLGEGMDEIQIDPAFILLNLTNDDPDLFSLEPLEGYASFTEGNGARVIPERVGIGYVTPIISGRTWDPIQVTIPPQELVQILIGEARGPLDDEATVEDDVVKVSSVSVTGDAVGAVIRNRIALINETGSPGLFLADPDAYESDPPASYYQAVIEANNGTIYQFSPVAPDDPSHDAYESAANRNSLEEDLLAAYDQAVLTAADIFNEETEDPTGGAFAFYSPTEAEYEILQASLLARDLDLPEDGGASDANFPALAPVQILVLPGIAPSHISDDVPSFVFVRTRSTAEPAVTNEP